MVSTSFDAAPWASRLALQWLASVATLMAGCSDDTSSERLSGAGGADLAGCEELDLRIGEFTEEGQPLTLLQDGDFLRLWNAPQGGHVLLVGAEVRGLTDNVVSIEARLLSQDTKELVQDDVRSIIMKPIEAEPEWMSPEIRSRSQVAHIPLCPDAQRRTLQGQDFLLEVEISEIDTECGLKKAESVRVVPDCLQRDAAERSFCSCQCQPDYEPGSCTL